MGTGKICMVYSLVVRTSRARNGNVPFANGFYANAVNDCR